MDMPRALTGKKAIGRQTPLPEEELEAARRHIEQLESTVQDLLGQMAMTQAEAVSSAVRVDRDPGDD